MKDRSGLFLSNCFLYALWQWIKHPLSTRLFFVMRPSACCFHMAALRNGRYMDFSAARPPRCMLLFWGQPRNLPEESFLRWRRNWEENHEEW